MTATLAHAPQKSLEWLAKNPAASATLARFETTRKKISRKGYHLLLIHLANLLPNDDHIRTVETHPKVRLYMGQTHGIIRAADKIAAFLTFVKIARDRFSQAIAAAIDSAKEGAYLAGLFNLLILYCHADQL